MPPTDCFRSFFTSSGHSPGHSPGRFGLFVATALAALSLLTGPEAHAQMPQAGVCAFGADNSPWLLSPNRLIAAQGSALIPLRDQRVMVCGGVTPIGNSSDFCEIWDPAGAGWDILQDQMPQLMNAPLGLELEDGRVMVCNAAFTPAGGTALPAACYTYDPAFGTWLTMPAVPSQMSNLGGPNNYEILQRDDGTVLIYAVARGANSCRIALYTPDATNWAAGTWQWTQPASCGYGIAVNEDGEEIYAPSVRSGAVGNVQRRGYRLDYSTFTFIAETTEPPGPRTSHWSMPVDGGYWQAGGFQSIWTTQFATRSSSVFDAETGTWSPAAPIPYFFNYNSTWHYLPIGNGRWLTRLWSSGISGLTVLDTNFWYFDTASTEIGRVCRATGTRPNPSGTGTITLNETPIWQPNQTISARDPARAGRAYFMDQNSGYYFVRVYDGNAGDTDEDGVADCCDNCPNDPNPLQRDNNNNSIGDLCEACGDGILGLPTSPRNEQIDIQAARFRRDWPELAGVGTTVTIRLTVTNPTFLRYLRIEEAVPADTVLTDGPGSNIFEATDVASNSTLVFEYRLTMPADQGNIFGDATIAVQPIGLGQESFTFPMSILVFRAETCDFGDAQGEREGCVVDTCQTMEGWICRNENRSFPDLGRTLPASVGCEPVCGDGLVVGNEGCDDGNTINGDGCSGARSTGNFEWVGGWPGDIQCARLYPNWATGNARGCHGCFVEPGWVCDTPGAPCRPVCGDGRVVGNEGCDDGNTANGDGCSATCQVESGFDCSFGISWTGPHVFPWATLNMSATRSGCLPRCGDGIVLPGEGCDDGNTSGGDGCSGAVSVQSWQRQTCLDFYRTADWSNPNSPAYTSPLYFQCLGCKIEPGYECQGLDCGPICGDGQVLEPETCDDQNATAGDGCSDTCTIESGWYCPPETVCAWDPTIQQTRCRVQSIHCYPICGDNLVVGDEECDDGNTSAGDGCTGRETSELCARLLRDYERGLIAINNVPGNCFGCRTERCGDGVTQTDEGCDDGNEVSGDGCSATCTLESGWVCEDNFGRSDCTPICGDGIILGAETCDDGNAESLDGCSDNCRVELGFLCGAAGTACANVCGDGLMVAGETCDDGNTAAGDGCSATCAIENGWACDLTEGPRTNVPSCCNIAADGYIACDDQPTETPACEDSPVIGFTHTNFGTEVDIIEAGVLEIIRAQSGPIYNRVVEGIGSNGTSPRNTQWNSQGWANLETAPTRTFTDFTTANLGRIGNNVVGTELIMRYESPALGRTRYFKVKFSQWTCCGQGGGFAYTREELPPCKFGPTAQLICPDDACQFCATYDYPPSGSVCAPVCGDGIRLGTEQCDDTNVISGDGCTADCRVEPGYDCTSGTTCTGICGDGLIAANEACDDGNTTAGDGCSSTCTTEEGWTCDAGNAAIPGALVCCDSAAPALAGCETAASRGCTPPSAPVTIDIPAFNTGSDVIEDGVVVLQRDFDGRGLYNAALPDATYDPTLGSPIGTEWHMGDLDDVSDLATRAFAPAPDVFDFEDPTTFVGEPLVMRFFSPSLNRTRYFAITFFRWSQPDADEPSGYAYHRTEIDPSLYDPDFALRCMHCAIADLPPGLSTCDGLCGDGLIRGTEGCDDRNTASGDGCDPTCRVEPGFDCRPDGFLCGAICGDGLVAGLETCDDGNLVAGDGCDSNCRTESGWACSATSGTRRGITVCCDFDGFAAAECVAGDTIGCDFTPVSFTRPNVFTGCDARLGPIDIIEEGVIEIARDGCSGGLFNIANETAFDRDISPRLTGWTADTSGDIADIETRRYDTWTEVHDGNPRNLVGQTVIMRYDSLREGRTRYFRFTFGSWQGGGNGGGFSYVREEIPPSAFDPEADGRCANCRIGDLPPVGQGCAAVCGDGVVLGDEDCDDGNTNNNDGCNAACRVEPGFACTAPGQSCTSICGDGLVTGSETCDDGNATALDGCSATCRIEDGWSCTQTAAARWNVLSCCGDDGEGDYGCQPLVDVLRPDELAPPACVLGEEVSSEYGPNGETAPVDPNVMIPQDGAIIAWNADGWDDLSDVNRRTFLAADTFFDNLEGDWTGRPFVMRFFSPSLGRMRYFTVELVVLDEVANTGTYLRREIPPCTWEPAAPTGLPCPSDRCDHCGMFNLPGGSSVCQGRCGDGIQVAGEGCDDGNTTSGDGCSSACAVELGWDCRLPGFACQPKCGDGILLGFEQCDDGNTTPGDGCSRFCTVELGWDCPEAGVSCVALCGDNLVRGTEECDDGNRVAGDGCDTMCTIEEGFACPPSGGPCVSSCGDGVLDANEACDDGNRTSGDGCSRGCRIEDGYVCEVPGAICRRTCGDGRLDVTEDCDDGNTTSGDGCTAGCRLEDGFVCATPGRLCVLTCGNGVLEAGESCDDGNLSSGDGCTRNCQIEDGYACLVAGSLCQAVCGDGLLVGAERCDDGNAEAGDGCDARCDIEPGWTCAEIGVACETTCGDGIARGDEGCDDGNTNPRDGCDASCQPEDGWACPPAGGPCARTCGNGVIDEAETCDDANVTSGDGCSASCRIEPGWTCETPGALCFTVCGDGVRVSPEHCDDANVVNGDGCSETCQVEAGWECPPELEGRCRPLCGDGIRVGGEACDDGNIDVGDGCDASCEIEDGWVCPVPGVPCELEPFCGDGKVDAGEGCDDGNTADGDGCSATCEVEPFCGDGNVDAGEGCDDGNTADGDGCSATCEVEPFCGDGEVDAGEGCDDGNTEDGDGCSATCEVEPFCGDGEVDAGEGCDDGNTADGDGCSATCEVEVVPPDDRGIIATGGGCSSGESGFPVGLGLAVGAGLLMLARRRRVAARWLCG